jgi:glycosyltransferase involved in cell wall biosynthesis
MSLSTHSGNPEVSVLMSCYNGARWLHEAIDSVLAQTFEDFEFILVDDGSTDETWNIIQSYRDQDQRMVAISKKNTGLADSLNLGIARARGAWIARLDADDLCEPTRIEEQLDFVRNHADVVLLGAGFIEIDEQGRSMKKHLYPLRHRELVRHLERLQRFFPHSSALFRRRIAQDAGCYNHLFRKSQDWDLWLRLAERGRIASLENCLVVVRKHSEQISNSATGTSQLAYGTAASACHFLRIRGYPDPSTSNDDTTWQEFIAWLETRMIEEGTPIRHKAWVDARTEYFAIENRLSGAIRLGTRFLRDGDSWKLMREKFLGSSLPQRLAREWMAAQLK